MDRFRFLQFRLAPHRSWLAYCLLPLPGLLLALAGPFGSYTSMDVWSRIAHFVLCFTAIGVLILEGSYRVARRFFAGNWPLWVALIFDFALAVPGALIVWGSMHVFGKASLANVRFSDLIWQNLLITLAVQAIFVVVAIVQENRLLQVPPAPVGESFPLAEKLPFALKRAPVIALSSEDHYLRVYTARGEALIHMTLTEAMALLGGGFQVHRSHWISDGSVRESRATEVELRSGLKLPISRHRQKGV